MKVLISDRMDPRSAEYLASHGIEPVVKVGLPSGELKPLLADIEGWIVRSGTTITDELMEAAPRLRVIGRAGVGVDNIDVGAATRRGIVVINAPDGNTLSTAEHTCAMLMAVARTVPQAHGSMISGAWDRKSYTGTELFGKTLGIVGVGKVGQAVAERMAAFGVRLLGFDPVVTKEVVERLGIELVSLDELVERSDIITVHTPLTDLTRNLFDDKLFARCRKGVMIVNCARGGIIDEAALVRALDAGIVSGAALDVYSQEPPSDELRALLRHDRIVQTPHIAASTHEAQQKVADQVTEQVVSALRGEPVATPVNAAAIKMASRPEMQPFMELTEALGRFVAQVAGVRAISRVKVRISGDVPHKAVQVLSVAALKGILSELTDETVNLVNAVLLADQAGLRVDEEVAGSAADYQNLVEVLLDTADGPHRVAGTVFGGQEIRIVRIDDFWVEVKPEGWILFYRNEDRPGMLAAVGSLLAASGINIGTAALGRAEARREALTIMRVDEALSSAQLDQIGRLEGVRDVRQLRVGG